MTHYMAKYKYFELDEFIKSDTAKAKGIDNTPTFEVVDHLNELVSKILNKLRADWGSAIEVHSGFRCEKLNKAVGGSSTSVHKLGYAADLVPANGKFDEFVKFVEDWVKKNKIKFDQVIIESNSKGDRWLHIGLYNNAGQQRGQIKVMNV